MNEITADTRTGVQTQPDLFVAYAESDTGWVHGFLLPELGLDSRSVLTPQDFRPGAALVEELDRAVETARLTVLVLSRAFATSQWSAFAELLATHDTLRRNAARLVPVLLEAYELPLHLDFRVRLDFTARSRWEAEATRLRQLLERGPPPTERLPCPYPGLLAFGPEEAGLFFGRDRESDDISRRLGQHGFLLVVGPSGSGKSSLVSAGVVPRLMASDSVRWLVHTLRPDAKDLRWLTGTFGDRSPDGLRESVDTLLRAAPGAERLVCFLDQAEAIFLLPSKEDRTRLLALLDRLRRVDRCVVLLAMRADFYDKLMTSVLWPIAPGERVEIAPLRSTALREAITRPAAGVSAHLESVLVERLMHDAGEEPGALSLLQETMVLLWERRTRRLLTVSAYEDLGGPDRNGLTAALATRADASLAVLTPAQQTIARRIFLRLVQLGEGRQDTRRPQVVSALRAPGDDPALFDATLRHLTDRRLVTVSGTGGEEPVVDLGHEAMIAHWPTLSDWIDENRASEMARRRIERDAADWRSRRDPGELYRRRKLADALDVAARREHELSQNATRFLAASRRLRLLVRLGLATVVAAALAGVAWLAKTPVRDAWLRHQAEAYSPTVTLPGGPALVGPDNRRVIFPSLRVDVHEVSNQQYRYCVQAQQCPQPDEPADGARFAHGDLHHPVVWVTAYDAAQFCTWIGRRLPTEPEWERIARGTNGAKYPWGNAAPRPGQVNVGVGGRRPPHPMEPPGAAALRSGDSGDGVEQLIGNAREWTATQAHYAADNTTVIQQGTWNGRDRAPGLVIIGLGYMDDVTTVVKSRLVSGPNIPDAETGFRCVATTN